AEVPFGKGNRLKRALVTETGVLPSEEIDPSRIKEIASVDPQIHLNEEMVRTMQWMRQRYGIKYYDALHCFIPPGKPAKPGKSKRPYARTKGEVQEVEALTDEQAAAVGRIEDSMNQGKGEIFLLHGVTSSGKTEVYMRVIQHALDMGKTAILLVPEIALTEQIVRRLLGRFDREEIAVLHSKLTRRERFDEWMRLRNGEAHIAVGARIGVFAPLENIGVIILDEEHESTYKSDQTPKYETVDVAVKRLMYTKGVLVLGSATPSVVSYERAREGLYTLIELKKRYNKTPLPLVEMVDMRTELRSGNTGIFSRRLLSSMKGTLASGKQVILFQNRRGYSTFISCRDCGEALRCPDCGISLVYHKHEHAAVCHYCGRKFPLPEKCPSCGSRRIKYFGVGTEQVEETAAREFPEARIERLDLDTAKNRTEINRMIRSFSKGETNILIGTQLVAKGLDFRNVGLVGVISADVSLNIPDYRSTERTFQLVTQVAGRAGRGSEQGLVIVQSYTPDNFALQAAASHDYLSFFKQEIVIRKFMEYPPFTDLIVAAFTSENEQTAMEMAERCKTYLERAGLPNADKILMPRLSMNFKGKDSFRYHIMVKAPRGSRNKYIYYLRYFNRSILKQKIDCAMLIDVNAYSSY
ncbi:MAG: primosomal protein N', partial [Eubacterium sp.]|nr:primosomal protein N' [Eubacterium sp.]